MHYPALYSFVLQIHLSTKCPLLFKLIFLRLRLLHQQNMWLLNGTVLLSQIFRISFCVWCVICVQQHALRLMAFGQIYKVLEMEPLPSNKPSQKYPWSDKEGVYLFLFPIAALPAHPVLDQTRPWLSSHTCHDLSGCIMCFLCTSVALPASSERLTY